MTKVPVVPVPGQAQLPGWADVPTAVPLALTLPTSRQPMPESTPLEMENAKALPAWAQAPASLPLSVLV